MSQSRVALGVNVKAALALSSWKVHPQLTPYFKTDSVIMDSVRFIVWVCG